MAAIAVDPTKMRDLTECSVCMEVFVDPQKLPCDHSFCAGCVEPLKQGSRIECPLCRTVHDVIRIRSDFRTQQIVDALKVETKPKDTKTTCIGKFSVTSLSHVNTYYFHIDIDHVRLFTRECIGFVPSSIA